MYHVYKSLLMTKHTLKTYFILSCNNRKFQIEPELTILKYWVHFHVSRIIIHSRIGLHSISNSQGMIIAIYLAV